MTKLRFGDGSVTVEMSDELDRIYRAALEKLAPGLVGRITSATKAVFDNAVAQWPVVSGRSKAGLQMSVQISSDQKVIRGRIWNDVEYARYVKPKGLDGKSAFVELLRKPMALASKELQPGLIEDAVQALREG